MENPLAEPPTIIVHHLDHARAALAAAEETATGVRLLSAPGAAAFGGASWFADMIRLARQEHPGAEAEAVLDCGAEPGLALAAIREGVEAIRIRATAETRGRIAAIAAAAGCRLIGSAAAPVLDLLDSPDPETESKTWLNARKGRD